MSSARPPRATDPLEVVIAVAPAFADTIRQTINGLDHGDVLAAIVDGAAEAGAVPRIVRIRRVADVAFVAHDGARLSGSGVALGIQSKGTAVIHRADLQPLDNLELFGMSPLYTLESYRAMGRNAAGYALGRRVGPVPTELDNFARAKVIVRTTLLHAARDARCRARGRAGRARRSRARACGAIGSRLCDVRPLSCAMVVGLTALAAGCGGGSDSSSSSTTSASDWASGYCGDASTWVTTLDKARASVKPNDPAATASDAAQQVTAETNTFTQTIKGLGEPDTPDGSTSEATAKCLANTLGGTHGACVVGDQHEQPGRDAGAARRRADQVDCQPRRCRESHHQARAGRRGTGNGDARLFGLHAP